MTAPVPAPPSSADLARRRRTTAAVFTGHRRATELDDGYRFAYADTAAWRETLARFVDLWRPSCPHMHFDVVREDDGSPALEVRGPVGTKPWIENAQHMLTSSLNPAPSIRNTLRRAWRLATSPLRVLPDFLILGAKKCGTTSLYAYLLAHPEIDSAFRKEVHFFDGQLRLGRLWYRSFFPTLLTRELGRLRCGRPRLTGEATPDYLFRPHAAADVRAVVPRAKLIALLRDPVDRAWSFYHHNLRSGLETLPFEEALEREASELGDHVATARAGDFDFARNNRSYLARGRYADQLAGWYEQFPRERLLVLATEELQADPAAVLRHTLDFLGLPYAAPETFRRINAAPNPPMDPGLRERVRERMRPHNERLYALVGRDFGW